MGLVLAVAGIDAGGASTFTELARGYELDERQRRLVHMLAAVAAWRETLKELEQFALYLAGRER